MDFIKSGWKTVVGVPQDNDQPTVVETVSSKPGEEEEENIALFQRDCF